MNRNTLEQYILETYSAEAEYPWVKYPNFAVFRHANNKKWFALIMDVSKKKLGLQEEGCLSVVNLKCDRILVGSLREQPGFFPAYHMDKENWITVALDNRVPDETIQMLLDMSFEATVGQKKKRK